MKIVLLKEDNLYFHHSLNQKIHDYILSLEKNLSLENILKDLTKNDKVRNHIA